MNVPEKLTLIERFVKLIPLPYTWAAVLWTAILGPPGGALFQYIDTGLVVFYPTLGSLFNSLFLVIVLFYVFYVARYLRLRILRAEQHIVPILSGGENEYRSTFGRISNPRPVIVLTVIFSTLEILSTLPITIGLNNLLFLVQYVVIALGLSSFIWEYSVSNWGLHRLGRGQLTLRSFLEDRMMGAKPVGNAALSSTVAYLGGVLFAFLLGTSNPRINGPGLVGTTIILIALGIVMFFLPLNSLHRKMKLEKMHNVKELNQRFLMIRQDQKNLGDGPASRMSGEDATVQLLRLKEYEITERKLAATPTWPFDVVVLAKLTTIALSVTAVLLTRAITDYLIRI